jgi:hypothetical protein
MLCDLDRCIIIIKKGYISCNGYLSLDTISECSRFVDYKPFVVSGQTYFKSLSSRFRDGTEESHENLSRVWKRLDRD